MHRFYSVHVDVSRNARPAWTIYTECFAPGACPLLYILACILSPSRDEKKMSLLHHFRKNRHRIGKCCIVHRMSNTAPLARGIPNDANRPAFPAVIHFCRCMIHGSEMSGLGRIWGRSWWTGLTAGLGWTGLVVGDFVFFWAFRTSASQHKHGVYWMGWVWRDRRSGR